MSKKVILAVVNGVLCVDPGDLSEINLATVKDKLRSKFGDNIPINISPISTWMPKQGTKALMEEAMKAMDANALMASSHIKQPAMYNNRHARRAKRNRK